MSKRIVAFDTETYLIEPGLLAPPLVSLAFAQRVYGELETDLHGAESGVETLSRCLYLDCIIVGHNVAYDLAVVCARNPELIPLVFRAYADGRIRDTQIRQELLDIAAGRRDRFVWTGSEWAVADYTLAGLLKRYGGRDRSAEKSGEDVWRMRYHELDGVPVVEWPAAARKYALDDAADTLFVYEQQGNFNLDYVHDDGALVNEVAQTQAAWALHLMSCWGMRTDGPRVTDLKDHLLTEQKKARETLIASGLLVPKRCTAEEVRKGKVEFTRPAIKKATKKQIESGDFDGLQDGVPFKSVPGKEVAYRWARDMKAIRARVEAAFKKQGAWGGLAYDIPETDGGDTATDKDTLNRSGDEVLALLGDAGGVDKILNTYVPVLEQGAWVPVNPRFQVLVNSGRTSCREPNIQNLPTGRKVGGVRECFIPRPGFFLVSVDYSVLELRALAEICLAWFGFSKLADAFRSGRDPHTQFAAEMLGITYDELRKRLKGPHNHEGEGFSWSCPKCEGKRNRDCAKVADFGLPGGLSAETLVDYARTGYGVELTFEQAHKLRSDFFSTWPEIRLYLDRISALVGNGDANIEQIKSGRVRGGVGYTDGANSFFQGLAADGSKAACFITAFESYVDLGTDLYGCRPVAFIHDELILEVPAWNAHWASERLAEVMCSAMQEWLPSVPVIAEPALMTRWWKAAEAVYDENGFLIPWQPASAAA